MQHLTWILLATLVAPAVTPPTRTRQGAEAQETQRVPVYRSKVNLVALNVTVQDTKSRYVTGLQPADFAIFEDGVRQHVRFVESTGLPIDLVVLLDTSGSMAGQMDTVREAARGFLHTLRPQDRGAVVAFNENVSILQGLTDDRTALSKGIEATEPGGRTALHTAVYVALRQFGQSARTSEVIRRQAIAVLSDGEDNASLVPFDDVLALARETGVNVYTLRLQSRTSRQQQAAAGIPPFRSPTDYDMRKLATETGALSFFPAPHELRGVYAAIAQELANQYSVMYEPTDDRTDGTLRKVIVEVVNRPDLRARTRLGYTAKK